MKKGIVAFLFLAFLFVGSQAQAQKVRYYYYPNSNVYYDGAHRQYIYSDNGNWTTVATLPPTYHVRNTRRVIVYSNGNNDIWSDNEMHMKKYHYPNGKAVGYKGSNPHKANGKYKH